MAPRAFPQGVERLVRRATIVNSADDIRRVTTQCLADGTPCVLELGDNIVCSAGFTIPGGLKAFSVDGAQRFKFIVSGDLPFLFYAKGAENNDGCPVEVSNVTVQVKAGSSLETVFVVEQVSAVSAATFSDTLTVTSIYVDATAAGASCTNLFAHGDYQHPVGFRIGRFFAEDVSINGVDNVLAVGDATMFWTDCSVRNMLISGSVAATFGQGVASSVFNGIVENLVAPSTVFSVGSRSTVSLQYARLDSFIGTSVSVLGKITLLRVSTATTRTLTAFDVDLDNISVPAAPSLGLADWWHEARFGSNNAAAMDFFVGAAVSSGTNTTAIPAAAVDGGIPAGVFLRSNTTANGGYRYQTSSLVGDRFGVTSHKYWCQFRWRTAFAGRTVFLGFHDSATVADPVDGAYFKVTTNIVSAVTANNSTRTTNATTVTLSLDVIYTFDVEVNAAGNSARFRVYAGTSATPILDVTNTTNIPTTSARAFGTGIVATESSTTASDIGILYMQGAGTVAGFERARGQP